VAGAYTNSMKGAKETVLYDIDGTIGGLLKQAPPNDGILGAVGHFLLIRAHGLAPATLLAPFGYTQLLVVLALGWLVFGQLPDGVALTGIALIAGSGLALIVTAGSSRSY